MDRQKPSKKEISLKSANKRRKRYQRAAAFAGSMLLCGCMSINLVFQLYKIGRDNALIEENMIASNTVSSVYVQQEEEIDNTIDDTIDHIYQEKVFPANVPDGYDPDLYQLVQTIEGRLWQPYLPPGNERVPHSVEFELDEGRYMFNGIVAELYAVPSGDGDYSLVCQRKNDYVFDVDTHSRFYVMCDGGKSSGFEIVPAY